MTVVSVSSVSQTRQHQGSWWPSAWLVFTWPLLVKCPHSAGTFSMETSPSRVCCSTGLNVAPGENKSCLWRISLVLNYKTGVIREFRSKPQKRTSLRIPSQVQLFFSLALSQALIPGIWAGVTVGCVFNPSRGKFRTLLDRALSRLVSLWSWPCCGSGRWQPGPPSDLFILWFCDGSILSASVTAIHFKSSLKIFSGQCYVLLFQILSVLSKSSSIGGRDGNKIMLLSERFLAALSARNDGWRRLWLQTVRWLNIMEVTMWNHTSLL